MSSEDVTRFREFVLSNIEVQNELRDVLGRSEFVDLVARLARENGYDLTRDEIENALRAGRRDWIERWI